MFDSFPDMPDGNLKNVMQRKDGDKNQSVPLRLLSVSDVTEASIERRKQHPNWIALQELLSERLPYNTVWLIDRCRLQTTLRFPTDRLPAQESPATA